MIAWDNHLFVETIQRTGEMTLIMANVWKSLCVMFHAVDAKAAGFHVFAVINASGDPSAMLSRTTLARSAQSGIRPATINTRICEHSRTWKRPEEADIAEIYVAASPGYRAVMERHQRAKDVSAAEKRR